MVTLESTIWFKINQEIVIYIYYLSIISIYINHSLIILFLYIYKIKNKCIISFPKWVFDNNI